MDIDWACICIAQKPYHIPDPPGSNKPPWAIQLWIWRLFISWWWMVSWRSSMWIWCMLCRVWWIAGSWWYGWIQGVFSVTMPERKGSVSNQSSTIMLWRMIAQIIIALTYYKCHSLQGCAIMPHWICRTPKARSMSLRAASWSIEESFPEGLVAWRRVLTRTGQFGYIPSAK